MLIITDAKQLKPNSKLGMRKQKIVSVLVDNTIAEMQNRRENLDLLEESRRWWDSMRNSRKERRRNRMYWSGEQWGDSIEDPETGRTIVEEDYLKVQGKVPLKQNMIKPMMKNLIGQYRSNPAKVVVVARARENATATEMLTNALQCAMDLNMSGELDARNFEEFGLSGACIQKIGYSYWKERNLEDLLVENVNFNRFFCNTDVSDIRLRDLRICGEIIDTTVEDIVSTFAKSPDDEQRIRAIYTGLVTKEYQTDRGFDALRVDHMDFYYPTDPNKARIYEIWKLRSEWRVYVHDPMDGKRRIVQYTLEEVGQMNAERIKMGRAQGMPDEEIPLIEAERKNEQFWYVKFLTPHGDCLFEGETPYTHEEHPYVITLYPLVDGLVKGFVGDVIDQQRYINRLVILMDFIISASAKGVLMIPEDCLNGKNPEEFADEWRSFNGVIVYKPSDKGVKPEQISANSTAIGIPELLSLQMNLIQQVSGVHDAIQGKNATAGTPAALYAQEAQNASINNLDYMEVFRAFRKKRDTKALKVITQYYDDKRYLAINGRATSEESRIYDPELVENLDFEVTVTQGTDTPAYRQVIEDTLTKLLDSQMISLEMYLEQTSMPFADKLLAAVRAQKQQMAQGGAVQGMTPEMMQQIQADPKAVQMAQRAIGMKQTAAA